MIHFWAKDNFLSMPVPWQGWGVGEELELFFWFKCSLGYLEA